MRNIPVSVFKWMVCVVILLCSGLAGASESSVYFLSMSDIHFDPYAGCYDVRQTPCPLMQRLRSAPAHQWRLILSAADTAEPRYRRDTNYILLQKNLQEAKAAAAKNQADFVLVLGDTVGHDFRRYYKKYSLDKSQDGYRDFVRKTLEFMNYELAAAFPDKDVFMVVGNNDTYSRNYQSVPGGEFFQQTGALWSTLIKSAGPRTAMRQDFSTAGYYAVNIPGHPDLRLIVMNSVLFSLKSTGSGSQRAAMLQLNWLQQQLRQAKSQQQKVLIALHIPPGLDVYATRRWRLFTFLEFWRPEFIERFKKELGDYYPQIIAVISGHLHYDWTQTVMLSGRRDVPMITVPSVSPIFGNDPGFKIYHYLPSSGRIDDFDTYTYPVKGRGTWSIEHAYNLWLRPELAR